MFESCFLTAEDIHPRSVPERHLRSVRNEESQTAGSPAAFCPAAVEQLHQRVRPWPHTASAVSLGSRPRCGAKHHVHSVDWLESHVDRGEWRRVLLIRMGAELSFPSFASVLFPLPLHCLFHLQPFHFPNHYFLSFPSHNPSSFPFISPNPPSIPSPLLSFLKAPHCHFWIRLPLIHILWRGISFCEDGANVTSKEEAETGTKSCCSCNKKRGKEESQFYCHESPL